MKKLLVLLLLLIACRSDAAFHGSPPVHPELARGQVNLGGGGFSHFATNLISVTSNSWTYGNGSGLGFPISTELDANGYPLYDGVNTHAGWQFTSINVPMQYERSGSFVVTWAGQGDVDMRFQTTASFNSQACTAVNSSGGGVVECSNVGCTAGTGYIVATTFHSVTAPSGSGSCATLNIGQPISGGNSQISSGTYNQATGAVSLTLANAIGVNVGDTVSVQALLGTGEIYQINGQFTATSGSTGTTLNYTAATGLTLTITGGNVEVGAVNTFGVPTIITGAGVSCDAGLHTCYPINFSQTVGSSGAVETIYPGGRIKMSVTNEPVNYNTWQSATRIILHSTGSASVQSNIARHISFVRTDGSGNAATDDEVNWWLGNIVSVDYKTFAGSNGANGIYRDLALNGNAVNSNCTTWNTAKPTTYFSQYANYLKKNEYGGTTTHTSVTEASFTGQFGGSFTISSGSGTTLNVTGMTGYLMPGDLVAGTGVPGNTIIVNQISGTPGGAGAYETTTTVTGATGAGTFTSQYLYVSVVTSGALTTGSYIPNSMGIAGGLTYITNVPAKSPFCPTCTGTGGVGTYALGFSPTNYILGGVTRYSIAATPVTVTANKYTVNFLPSPPQDKDTVTVLWDATNADLTTMLFSADGVTYSPIFDDGGGLNLNGQNVQANTMGTLVFDSTLGGWILWRGTAGNAYGLACGVTPEFFLEAVHELGGTAHTTESSLMAVPTRTDWYTQFALMQQRKYPGLFVKYETMDETWDGIPANIGAILFQNVTQALGRVAFQNLVVSSPSAAGTNVIHFGTLPAWVKVGVSVTNLTRNSGMLNNVVTAINSPSTGDITLQNNIPPFSAGTSTGDIIGFSWASALVGQPGLGGNAAEITGKEASTLGQAISAAYNGDLTKYDVMVGVNTNGNSDSPTDAQNRLLASAFIGEDNSLVPLQSGCAGRDAIQTKCPSFQRSPAYNWATRISPQTYTTATNIAFSPLDGTITAGSLSEIYWAYCLINEASGCPSATSLMDTYFATMENPWEQDTIANFNTIIWPNFYNWGRGCNGKLAQPTCPIKGLSAYEGGYSAISTIFDFYQPVFSANNNATCKLNTTWTFKGYMNDNGAAGDGIPGNFITVNTSTSPTVFAALDLAHIDTPQRMGPVMMGLTVTAGATGSQTTLGATTRTNGYSANFVVDGAAEYHADGTTFTLAGNAGIDGQEVKLTNIIATGAGTSWTTKEGAHFIVNGTGLTNSLMPLKNMDGSTFDCSAFNTLQQAKLVYVNSANYITYFRLKTYTAPQLVTKTLEWYADFFNYGGEGASIINAADWQSTDANSGGTASGNDVYGYWTLAQTVPLTSPGTVSGTTMTINGPCAVPAGQDSPPAAAQIFKVGSPMYRANNTFIGNITQVLTGSGCAGTYSLSGTPPTISTPETLGSWSTTSGTSLVIGGILVGRFETGYAMTFNQSFGLNTPPLTVSAYACGGANLGCGSHVGDTVTLSGSAGTIAAPTEMFGSFLGPLPDGIAGWQGVKQWNRQHGG